MKVINFLGNKIGSGGVEAFVTNASYGMKERGVEYIVLVNYRSNNIYENKLRENEAEVEVLQNKPCSLIKRWTSFLKYCRNNTDAIIHIHASSTASYTYAFLAKVSGMKKIVYHIHSTPNPSCGFAKKIKDRILDILFNRIPIVKIACSMEAGKFYFHNSPFKIILNGIELERFRFFPKNRMAIRKELGLGDKLVIGHIGRMVYPKNQIHTLRVLHKYVREISEDVQLLLIGEGPDEPQLREYVETHQLEPYTRFIRPTDSIERYYYGIDLLMFPSIYEGLGIVAIEAQAAGLPVICSENIVDEVFITDTAYKCSLKDLGSWVNEWKEKPINTEERVICSNTGIEKIAQAGFSLDSLRNNLVEIYKKL